MNYRKPEMVLSPKDAVKKVTVLHDGRENSISVAKIKWYDKEVTGVRWNVAMREWYDIKKINGKECLGMPTSTGHPVWFIVPDDFFDKDSELWMKLEKKLKENK